MREDMYKMIVERPRWGSRWIDGTEGRLYRKSEDVPAKQGMKQGYGLRKSLNENLNPLKRYIAAQVNRPWNKVYSELCANIDRRNTVQEHIFAHISDFVCLDTRLNGEVVEVKRNRWGREWTPVHGSDVEIYVHPRTGILLRNRHHVSWARQRQANNEKVSHDREVRRRILSETAQLHLVDGIWYFVELAPLPKCAIKVTRESGVVKREVDRHTRWDVLLKEHLAALTAGGHHSDEPVTMYGKHGVYAISKRQLSSREIKKYGVQQAKAGDSRPFFFH